MTVTNVFFGFVHQPGYHTYKTTARQVKRSKTKETMNTAEATKEIKGDSTIELESRSPRPERFTTVVPNLAYLVADSRPSHPTPVESGEGDLARNYAANGDLNNNFVESLNNQGVMAKVNKKRSVTCNNGARKLAAATQNISDFAPDLIALELSENESEPTVNIPTKFNTQLSPSTESPDTTKKLKDANRVEVKESRAGAFMVQAKPNERQSGRTEHTKKLKDADRVEAKESRAGAFLIRTEPNERQARKSAATGSRAYASSLNVDSKVSGDKSKKLWKRSSTGSSDSLDNSFDATSIRPADNLKANKAEKAVVIGFSRIAIRDEGKSKKALADAGTDSLDLGDGAAIPEHSKDVKSKADKKSISLPEHSAQRCEVATPGVWKIIERKLACGGSDSTRDWNGSNSRRDFNRVGWRFGLGAYSVTSDGWRERRTKATLPIQPPSSLDVLGNQPPAQRYDVEQEVECQQLDKLTGIDTAAALEKDYLQKNFTPLNCLLKWKLLIFAVIATAVAVAVAIPLSGKGENSSTAASPSNINSDQREQTVRSVIVNITPPAVLYDVLSPQNMALNWIVQTDQMSPISGNLSLSATKKLLTRYALATFYYSLGGGQWYQKDGWLDVNKDECNWWNVSCVSQGIVTTIELEANNLAGKIPPEIQILTGLSSLSFPSNNNIQQLPEELGNLTGLECLDMQNNNLGGISPGTFPTMLTRLTNLGNLNLAGNFLKGTLPTEVSKLSNLKTFAIGDNSFTGPISSQLLSMTGLEHVDVGINKFTGDFMSIIGGLFNLTQVYFASNLFRGDLNGITNYRYVTDLRLYQNFLNGTIPANVGVLSHLVVLQLTQNELSGTIPAQLGNLTNLGQLDLNNNPKLRGNIPETLCHIGGLTEILVDSGIVCNCSSCANEPQRKTH